MSCPTPKKIPVKLYDETVTNINPTDGFVCLGTQASNVQYATPHTLFHDLVGDLEKIIQSEFLPWQKTHAYMTFLHSRLVYAFRNYNIPVMDLHETSTSLDMRVRTLLKNIIGLPPNTSNLYIYAPKTSGGVGMRPTFDEYLIQSIASAYFLLVCSDQTTSNIALWSLPNEWNMSSLPDAIHWINSRSIWQYQLVVQ